jgi:hypothetical protein
MSRCRSKNGQMAGFVAPKVGPDSTVRPGPEILDTTSGSGFRLGVMARERDRRPRPAGPVEGIGGRKRAVHSTGFRPGRHRMTHKRGSCIRGFLSSCGACKGGPPLALESAHDGSPKGGTCSSSRIDTGRGRRLLSNRENPVAGRSWEKAHCPQNLPAAGRSR